MTQDEIIAITRKLRICELTSKTKQDIHYSLTIHEMQTFAKLVAAKAEAKEREACAKVCEEEGLLWGRRYAAAIRARGQA